MIETWKLIAAVGVVAVLILGFCLLILGAFGALIDMGELE